MNTIYALGNIVRPIDTRIPGKVVLVEPHSILLANRSIMEADANITGVPLSVKWLKFLGFSVSGNKQNWRFVKNEQEINIEVIGNKFFFQSYRISFVHQLQNIVHNLIL